MKKTVIKKIKKKKGESLVETLAALLIASMGLMILSGAIISASRVTQTEKSIETVESPTIETDESPTERKVKLQSEEIAEYKVISYKSEEGNTQKYYYYAVDSESSIGDDSETEGE